MQKTIRINRRTYRVKDEVTGQFFFATAGTWRAREAAPLEETWGINGDCDGSNKARREDIFRRLSLDGRYALIARCRWESEGFTSVTVFQLEVES